uniref:Uncharacterized protein n=1 Tax=Melanopsichium pennsylvanicum 4 TaxID=1398559 RepID=A0A077R4N2_9BASI|nr:uncharacterized protein BN887_06143 [Melanopsichium pennsylvanicum 4]
MLRQNDAGKPDCETISVDTSTAFSQSRPNLLRQVLIRSYARSTLVSDNQHQAIQRRHMQLLANPGRYGGEMRTSRHTSRPTRGPPSRASERRQGPQRAERMTRSLISPVAVLSVWEARPQITFESQLEETK